MDLTTKRVKSIRFLVEILRSLFFVQKYFFQKISQTSVLCSIAFGIRMTVSLSIFSISIAFIFDKYTHFQEKRASLPFFYRLNRQQTLFFKFILHNYLK